MTQEEFIQILKKKKYSHEIEGDNIVVLERGVVSLGSLTSLPPDVEFRNEGNVWLGSLTSLPPGVEFRNGGGFYESIGSVYLRALIGGHFSDWKGNIEVIGSNRLLNLMISKGIFER
jgi:hypothetical protein